MGRDPRAHATARTAALSHRHLAFRARHGAAAQGQRWRKRSRNCAALQKLARRSGDGQADARHHELRRRSAARSAPVCCAAKSRRRRASTTKRIASLRAAATTEDRLIYNEPPDWPLPVSNYLGNALLKAKRPERCGAGVRERPAEVPEERLGPVRPGAGAGRDGQQAGRGRNAQAVRRRRGSGAIRSCRPRCSDVPSVLRTRENTRSMLPSHGPWYSASLRSAGVSLASANSISGSRNTRFVGAAACCGERGAQAGARRSSALRCARSRTVPLAERQLQRVLRHAVAQRVAFVHA